MNDGPVKRISGQTQAGGVVGICQTPPDQEEEINEAFFKHIEEVSPSEALILMHNFNNHSICWWFNRAGHKQPRRQLQCWEKKFYRSDQPDDRGNVLLDLLLTNKEKLVRDVKQPWPQWLSWKSCEKTKPAESQLWI